MSELIEEIHNETGEFREILESYHKKGYYNGRNDAMRILRKEFEELATEMKKADSFDTAILSVLVGYLKKVHNDMSQLKYEGLE